VREVPEATAPKDNAVEVPISLALSMPVFITPPPARREVECRAQRADGRSLQAVCSNSGTAYAQVRDITARRGAQTLARFEGGNYILPGARKAIDLKTEQPVAAGEMQMHVTFDDGKDAVFNVALP
jgi:fimbrial chaperone protein